MQIRQIMKTGVVSVRPETSAREIARLLIAHRISGVPVVDADNRVVGIVSDGDLISEHLPEREARRDWWLDVLAGGQSISAEYVKHLEEAHRTASQIMSRPVVTVGENDDIRAVAGLFDTRRIKRAPVTRDGLLVGMATRSDLLAALAQGPAEILPERPVATGHAGAPPTLPAPVAPKPEPPLAGALGGEATAAAFRQLATRYHENESLMRQQARDARRQHRDAEVRALLGAPLPDAEWRSLLDEARRAAESGLKEFTLLRFPAQLCSDGGRAVNAPDPDWPGTLRGKAALVFLRWREELRPAGFRMSARIATFPDGLPGDIELSLVWGADE